MEKVWIVVLGMATIAVLVGLALMPFKSNRRRGARMFFGGIFGIFVSGMGGAYESGAEAQRLGFMSAAERSAAKAHGITEPAAWKIKAVELDVQSAQGRVCRRWFTRGKRPPGLINQGYTFAYLYGIVEAEMDNAFALLLPEVTTHNMQVFVDAFAKTIRQDEHVALFIDGAGWHAAGDLKFPANITPIRLPPYAPATNPIERVWEHLKERYLSQRLLNDYDAIVDATCIAWNKLRADTGRIASLTWTPWKTVSQ